MSRQVVSMILRRCSLLAAVVVLTSCSSTSSPSGGSSGGSTAAQSKVLTVFSDWTGGDQAGFSNIVAAFAKESGIQVELSGSTDFLPVLQTRIAGGNKPMVAIVPRPGVIADLAGQKLLQPLDKLGVDLPGNYSTAMADLGKVGATPYGLIVKANSKSVIYYRPQSVPGGKAQPATWGDFKALLDGQSTKPLVITAKDGWTLTDWFENVYIRTAGPDKYQDLFTGKLPFTDASVSAAMTEMLSIIHNEKYVTGGLQVARSTGYQDGLARVFGNKPDGAFVMEGGFTTNVITKEVNPALKPGQDIAFFPFPSIGAQYGNPLVLGGDFAVAFSDNDATRKFMAFLAKPETAKLWAGLGVISPNKNADVTALPDVLMGQESQQLTGAEKVRFDGSDQLPGGVGTDWTAALEGIFADPSKMGGLLNDFQQSAAAAGFGR